MLTVQKIGWVFSTVSENLGLRLLHNTTLNPNTLHYTDQTKQPKVAPTDLNRPAIHGTECGASHTTVWSTCSLGWIPRTLTVFPVTVNAPKKFVCGKFQGSLHSSRGNTLTTQNWTTLWQHFSHAVQVELRSFVRCSHCACASRKRSPKGFLWMYIRTPQGHLWLCCSQNACRHERNFVLWST